ncbi:MAG TPA: S9 family peptidase [Planctomycetota bacterium]|nr:S9 family peptidase [Planctomycetota bacterium]
MKPRPLPSLLALLAASCAGTGPPRVAVYDAKTFYETVSLGGATFSADETHLLVSSDASGVFNAVAIPVAGGAPTRLTDSTTDAVMAVSYFPKDDRILVTSDRGGNERNHLFVRDVDGKTTDLTPGENVKARFLGWSGDDASFWVATNERDERFFDLYRCATDGYARALVFRNPGGFDVEDVSLDGRWVALSRVRNNEDSDVFVWDARAAGEEPRKVTPHEGSALHSFAAFPPDAGSLVYLTNVGSEFDRAWSVELPEGRRELVASADWDVSFVDFSRDGRYRVVGVNEDGRTRISVRDRKTGGEVRLPPVPRADIASAAFSRSGRFLAFYANGDTSPSNLHLLDLRTGEHRRLTTSLNPAVREEDLVASEVVRYPSFDGLRIPALLYRPKSASRTDRAPAVVWVHGGPGGQSRSGWRAEIQVLVNHGYAVLAVNNRGSSGYGKLFFHQDDRRHGEVDLQDCVFGRKYLETLDWVDPSRIGIMGGSYGGYMVAAALAFAPQAFEVGIDIFGVTNWLRTLKSIPPWWEAQRESLYAEMGDPGAEEERLRRISPLFHASNIRRPLLVVQGANDPRVLKVESDEIVEAARKNGVPVEYLVFPDEGHGFRSKKNRIAAAEAYLEFLDRHLGGRGEAARPAAATAR